MRSAVCVVVPSRSCRRKLSTWKALGIKTTASAECSGRNASPGYWFCCRFLACSAPSALRCSSRKTHRKLVLNEEDPARLALDAGYGTDRTLELRWPTHELDRVPRRDVPERKSVLDLHKLLCRTRQISSGSSTATGETHRKCVGIGAPKLPPLTGGGRRCVRLRCSDRVKSRGIAGGV